MVISPSPALGNQQVTTVDFVDDSSTGTSTATWNVTFSARGTSPDGDAVATTAVLSLIFTVHNSADGPPTMDVSGTDVQTTHDTPRGAPEFDVGPITIDASKLAGGPAPTLVTRLPDTVLQNHLNWQHPLRTESRTACS